MWNTMAFFAVLMVQWVAKKSHFFLNMYSNCMFHPGYTTFRHGTFWQESFRHGTIWQESFRHWYFTMGTFWHMHRLALRTFRHRDISAPEHFSTWIFGTLKRDMDILAQTFRHLWYCAEMPMCQNVPVPKCSCAKNSSCRKFLVQKSPHVEMFLCWNVHLPERLQHRMVHVPKCSRDETSVPKWLLPKCSGPKWSIGPRRLLPFIYLLRI